MKTMVTMTVNPSIDKSTRVAHATAEQKLYCKPPRFEPGGGGVNVARAIKKLGGESLLLYPVGGLTGKMLQKVLYREGVYLIKPNIREFGELVGKNLKEESQIKAAAQQLIKNGQCELLAISLGAAGALMVSGKGTERIISPTVPIISKVGAGDSMVAGIVLSLAGGRSARESVFFGVAAGAAAVMTPGTELRRREDAERLFESMISGVAL